MEKDQMLAALQEMESHPAWRLFQDHLELLCKRKEVEKCQALRVNNPFEAARKQFEIDGIILAVKSLHNLITSLSPEAEEK